MRIAGAVNISIVLTSDKNAYMVTFHKKYQFRLYSHCCVRVCVVNRACFHTKVCVVYKINKVYVNEF